MRGIRIDHRLIRQRRISGDVRGGRGRRQRRCRRLRRVERRHEAGATH